MIKKKKKKKSEPSHLQTFPDICALDLVLLDFLTLGPEHIGVDIIRHGETRLDEGHRRRVFREAVSFALVLQHRTNHIAPPLPLDEIHQSRTHRS